MRVLPINTPLSTVHSLLPVFYSSNTDFSPFRKPDLGTKGRKYAKQAGDFVLSVLKNS